MANFNIPNSTEHGEKDVEKVGESDLSKVTSVGNGYVQEPAGTRRRIKPRQAQMIAIGGSIGTSLFIATGQALAAGGPGFLLASYCLMAVLVYGIVTACIEVGTHLPLPGSSMGLFCGRYASKSLGVALGWLYVYSFGIVMAYEITAATILIDYWPHEVNVAVWITVIMIVVVVLNLCPVGIYAEAEFWFAGIKVILICGMLILSLVLMLGGGPSHERLGFMYWQDPGATKEYIVDGAGGRLTAFIYVLILSGFSFYFSPELIIFTSGEMRNPRQNLPTTSRQFFWRLILFYILGSVAIGATCNSNSSSLTTSTGNANASPWVIAIQNAGISTLPSIINAGILTSACSAAVSYLYMSSRSLYSLAVAGTAPAIFKTCNRYGLPYYAVLASSCFAPLAYMTCNSEAGEVFNWFISLTSTGRYTSWICCCVTFLRFRKACDAQGVAVPFRSRIQPWAAWICMAIFTILLLLNGFTNFYTGKFTVGGFISAYLGIPVFLAIWFGHKFSVGRNDPWLMDPNAVDLRTGLSEIEAESERAAGEESSKQKNHGSVTRWKKCVASVLQR
ncbi:proline permease PrnB [Biscogniauxia mediterranea]|nr:proline permease PrnB [Biscogniauxia mediterranea]